MNTREADAPVPVPTLPTESYVLRLDHESETVDNKVLDMIQADHDVVVLVRWFKSVVEPQVPAKGTQGLTLLRLDPLGKVVFQTAIDPSTHVDAGALVRIPGGFLVAFVVRDATGMSSPCTCLFDDAGKVLSGSLQTYFRTRARPVTIGIVPMQQVGTYLLGVGLAGTSSVFFSIGAKGAPLGGYPVHYFDQTGFMIRLRATATQGIFAVGQRRFSSPSFHHQGWLLNFDSLRAQPQWERTYRQFNVDGELRFADLAEGAASLVVVGSTAAGSVPYVSKEGLVLGFAKDSQGTLKWAVAPVYPQGDAPRLESVASYQVRPAAEAPVWSRFAVCGSARSNPWLFLIDDDGRVDWQKFFPKKTTPGELAAVVWPSYDEIVAGGRESALVTRPKALVVSSRPVPRSGTPFLVCSRQAYADFPAKVVTASANPIVTAPFSLELSTLPWVEGFRQPILPGCPQGPNDPPSGEEDV